MAKARRPKDPMQLAKLVGDIATGELPNDRKTPLRKRALSNVVKRTSKKKK